MAQLKQFKMHSDSLESPSKYNDGLSPDVKRYLSTLIKNSPFIIFALSPDGLIKYADGAALKSLGIPASATVGTSAFELYRHSPWIQQAIKETIETKQPVMAAGKLSNGVVDFWYEARYVPSFDEKGALSEIVGYAVDKTSEKRARDLAEQLAEEKIAAMTASMDGMASIGAEGNIRYVNDSFLKLYGFKDRTDLIGKNWRFLFEDSEIDRLIQVVRDALTRQQHWRGEAVARRSNGSYFFTEISLSQIRVSDQVKGTVCVVRDITEQKTHVTRRSFVMQAAAALSESLDYEITLKNAANFAVRKFSSWCVVTLVNEVGSIERVIVGADQGEKDISVLLSDIPFRCSEKYINKRVHLTHQMDEAHQVDEALLKDLFPDENERKRFEPLEISAYICVPLLASTTFLGAITFIKSKNKLNLGESPYYDEKDTSAAVEVAGRMALAVQNAKLYRETKEAVRSREDLIASVSHDLKNPLSAISINAELIARASETSSKSPVFKKLSGTIKASVDRMTSLIKELLELEKLRGGEFVVVKSEISAKSLVDTAMLEIEPLVVQKSITLFKSLPDNDVMINADRERLLQVFSNLLGNALKYTPRGGQIDISFINLSHEVQFSVRDTGPGIGKKDLPRIFDRYWRSENSDKMGAGIGLTIARAIIGAHGGSIWAESTFGRGSTFSFTIPRE
jgi:PAS domain S-box-containing protein